ncbi:MAG TPA: hypothetical protein VH110_01155 [Candidatus Acidoferrum sp.]|nr:hypothetical protein [Candidatus Acidoferrum sp.]
MRKRTFAAIGTGLLVGVFASSLGAQKSAPAATRARILLLPRRVVSGERATLAVLDLSGRLTPGVTVSFSNGDRFTTDATGRALFVAPLDPGVLFASIAGRAGQVATTILTPAEAASSPIEISSVPAVISLADRFEISGHGFCGDADANQVTIAGQRALVLASSPASLVVLPPVEMKSGAAAVEISCAKQNAPAFLTTFVALELHADSSSLKPGEHRMLSVQVRGTISKIVLEARNLGPDVAELAGGNVVKRSSSGGTNNVARFELVGRKRGSFLISIRLVPQVRRPAPVR